MIRVDRSRSSRQRLLLWRDIFLAESEAVVSYSLKSIVNKKYVETRSSSPSDQERTQDAVIQTCFQRSTSQP